jgi:hypothetical protein
MKKSSKGYVFSLLGGLIIVVCGLILGTGGFGSIAAAQFILFVMLGGVLSLFGTVVAICAVARSRVVLIFSILSLLWSIFPALMGIVPLASWRPELEHVGRTYYIFLLILGFIGMFGSILGTFGGIMLMKEKRKESTSNCLH